MKNKEELNAFKAAKNTINNMVYVDDSTSNSKSKKELIAKKDHVIVQNDFKLVIKKGDVIKDLPEKYIVTLKTEQVI